MIRLLFWLFEKQFTRIMFSRQSKGIDQSKLTFQFIDSEGQAYSAYNNDLDMSYDRKGYLDKCFLELQACVSGKELHVLIDAMDTALNKKDKQGKTYVDLSMIGHIVREIKNRKELLLHPDILMDIIAAVYIRHDEDPAIVDEEIHQQKIEQFKKDSLGGLRDFLFSNALTKYIPFSTPFNGDLHNMMKTWEVRIQSLQEQLRAYTLENESVST